MLPVELPFKTYTDLDGKPLDNGYVYLGQPAQDPITHPIAVFWDVDGNVPAAQPLRTINGYIVRAGTPANVYTNGSYSVGVYDAKQRQVFYAPSSSDFSANVALLSMLQSGAGAASIGRTPTTALAANNVGVALTELATRKLDKSDLDAALTNPVGRSAIIPNNKDVANRNLSVLGDSISHGAFALNSYMHAWVRVLTRCFNAEIGASSYGFVPLLSLGAGDTTTTDIHVVNFFGASWSGIDSSVDANAQGYPNGLAMRAGGTTSNITISVPSFQNRALVYYGKIPGGGTFTAAVNGVLAATVNTDGVAGTYGVQEIALADNGYGDCTIVLACASPAANPVDICGIAYLSAALEPVLNNFSQSGRRLRYVSESLVAAIMAESAMVIVALGHNDQGDADNNDGYYAAFMQRIVWLTSYAKAKGVRVVVPDFCWTAPPTSRTRLALQKLAADTDGLYIDLPAAIFGKNVPQSTGYLIDTLKMWTDGSHPNKAGHQWIAETIAKRLSLSCSSKARAIAYHDWWLPLVLKPATAVYNYFAAPSQVSSFKRNGAEILMRAFLHQSPAASFPIGTYQLQDGWHPKAELAVAQGYTGQAVIRSDTGAVVSSVFCNASGSLNLKVVDGAWLNYQDFAFSLPAA